MVKVHATYMQSLRPVLLLLVVLATILVFSWLIPPISQIKGFSGYLPLHIFLETLSIIVSMMVFAVCWNASVHGRAGNYSILAGAFCGVAILDFVHVLSYAGMPEFITPGSPNKAIFFWLAARSLSIMGLMAAAFLPWRPLQSKWVYWIWLFAFLLLVALLCWAGLWHLDWFPVSFIPGQGLTAFKVIFEYLLIALLIITGLRFLLLMRQPQSFEPVGLFAAVCVMALSEFYFTLYAEVTDIFNVMGHVYKVIAYGYIYHSIFLKAGERTWREANYDELTGLLNRRMFQDRLHQEILNSKRSGRMLALFLLDLDNFKEINDSLGHDMGDLVLRESAHRICACVRETDAVARLGGDEFTVILTNLDDAAYADTVAQKIVNAMTLPFAFKGEDCSLSVSLGISYGPGDNVDLDALIKQADQAMYEAKNQGRNRFCHFTPSLQSVARQQTELGTELQLALEREEFNLYYQPQLDVSTGEVTGVEALIRWQHPRHGLQTAAYFIDVAEDSGLMVPIGEWVLRTACRQLKTWADQGIKGLTMSVNLSAKQFHNASLARQVAATIDETGIDPSSLELEISEALALDDLERTSLTLGELQAIGVSLAIDNFGTGHSSLVEIKNLPINRLKLDGSFTINVETEAKDTAIVLSTIALAHDLGMHTIAGGIETQNQLNCVARESCDNIQGYYFCAPLPAGEVDAYIRKHMSSNQAKP